MPELTEPEPEPEPTPAGRSAPEGERSMAATADPMPTPTPTTSPEPTESATTSATATAAVDDGPPTGGQHGGARVTLLAVGTLLAVVLAVVAGMQAVKETTGQERHDERVTLPAAVDRLEVRSSSGTLTVTGGSGDAVVVDARLSGTVHPPRLKVEIDGRTARVYADCAWQSILLSCEASLRVAVPAGITVVARASSGDIRAVGVQGPVDLHTSSGDVVADGCSGAIRLSTSSGDVRASRLRATTVYAHSSSGDVNVGLAVAPVDVEATTSSGDVRVRLPDGAETYDATAHTSSGNDSIRVATDPRSDRRIEARSSSGDVSIRYADAGAGS